MFKPKKPPKGWTGEYDKLSAEDRAECDRRDDLRNRPRDEVIIELEERIERLERIVSEKLGLDT